MPNHKATVCLCLLALGAWIAQSTDVCAVGMRGGGGGGARGGMGGGARMGGGGGARPMGGGARPMGSMPHGSAPNLGGARPQVSRPQVSRPPNLGSPNMGGRPGGARPMPTTQNISRPNINRPNPGAIQRPVGGLNPPHANRPGGGVTLPGNLPQYGAGRPAQRPGNSAPNLGNRLPQQPSVRPGAGAGQLPTRPNRPGTTLPGGVNRPDFATRPGGHPSVGDLDDFLGIQTPHNASTRPAPRPGGDRPVTLPSRPGGDRPATLPGRPGDLPGAGNRPGGNNRPDGGTRPTPLPGRPGGAIRPGSGDRPDFPDWANRPGRPGGDWRPGGDNGHIHRPPSWADRPGAGGIGDRWDNVVTRPGNGMGNWIDRHPGRGAYWGNWGNNIRHNWDHYHHHNNWFGPNWWNGHYHHMGGWHYHYGYHNYRPSYWWGVPVWASLNNWFVWSTPTGYWSQPYYYDYGAGGNVTYQDNSVYIDGQQVGSTADFAASAAELATVQPPATEEQAEDAEWMPLGTFAVSTDEKDSQPSRSVQLAVNKQGVVSGTFYNSDTDEAQTVIGQVDKETQRVAMRIGESDDIVIETGLYNLTQDECPVMVHFGTEKTENWLLVRLKYEGDDSDSEDDRQN